MYVAWYISQLLKLPTTADAQYCCGIVSKHEAAKESLKDATMKYFVQLLHDHKAATHLENLETLAICQLPGNFHGIY